ncbi:MAG: DUF3071 domain-containing protein [Microbacteriaceae bacterium]|nr:DUF3071 domain-containing protein [Microbacteriaceae bacterium]
MRDLRLTSSEQNGIVLEALDGEKFLLEVDDAVKAAVRTAGAKAAPETSLTPRDIQERVRSGQGIDDIIAESGADAHFVEMFALPVIDELRHMVDSARSVRLTIPGDRFSDDSQIEFGELVDRRLVDNGASSISWSSKRSESAFWIVSVAFELAGNFGLASWLFDPRKVELAPEDETASALSVLDGNPGPLPKSRFATEPPAAFRKQTTAVKRESPKVAPVIDISSARETPSSTESPSRAEAEISVEPPTTTASMNVTTLHFKAENAVDEVLAVEDETGELVKADEPVEEFVEIETTVEVSVENEEHIDESLLTADAIVDEVESDDIEVAPFEDEEVHDSPGAGAGVEASPQEPTTATGSIGIAKKGRASMPSWDEIVFGTKTDD